MRHLPPQPHLAALSDITAVSLFLKFAIDAASVGAFHPPLTPAVEAALAARLNAIAPHALDLVDAFALSNFQIASELARTDGGVYEGLLALARANPVNKQSFRAKVYSESIRPLLKGKL
jgi:hypothetical protein